MSDAIGSAAAGAVVAGIGPLPVRLGRYTLLGLIGQGAAGTVYRAQQEHPRREVAWKLLHGAVPIGTDGQWLTLELHALARLRHPGIAHLYDAGTVEIEGRQRPFLVMELIDGPTLAAWREAAQPGRAEALRLIADIGAAVESAHQQGIVHRDLKPENIAIEMQGGRARPRVLDFGVARMADVATEGSGRVLGSLDFMSPEQAHGVEAVDHRTDVYALGALCYWLLSGRVPVPTHGLPLPAALAQVQSTAPAPLGTLAAALRGDLQLVVHKALARQPEERYGSVREFVEDLGRAQQHRPVAARPPTLLYQTRCLVRRQPWLCSLGAVAMLSLLLALEEGWRSYVHSAAELDRFLALSRAAVTKMLDPLSSLAGTSSARRAMLDDLLPQIEACRRLRPDDVELMRSHYEVLRLAGDVRVEAGEWSEARSLREAARVVQSELAERLPDDAAVNAEYATALVRLGDAHAELGDHALVDQFYGAAHVLYADLARRHPDSGRHVDDLGWSCDRLASRALRNGRLELADHYLDERASINERLRLLRPDSHHTTSGQRSLHTLRALAASSRGDRAAVLRELLAAAEFARIRLRQQPDSVLARLDLVSGLVACVERCGPELGLEAGLALCDEAELILTALLRLEPGNRTALLIRNNLDRRRGIHRVLFESDPWLAALQRATILLDYLDASVRIRSRDLSNGLRGEIVDAMRQVEALAIDATQVRSLQQRWQTLASALPDD